MTVYSIRDSKNVTSISKADAFSMQWLKIIQPRHIAKIAPGNMSDFVPGDVAVIYLDNDKPYGLIKENYLTNVTKLFIVGSLHKSNIKYLNDASYIIYLNEIQRKIAEDIYGIKVPSYTCPRHPLTVFNTSFPSTNSMYIGGIFNKTKREGFYDKLLNIHETTSKDIKYVILPGGTGKPHDAFSDLFTKWINASDLNGSRMVRLEFNVAFYDTMVIYMRSCNQSLLWKNEPTVEFIKNMVALNDRNVLDYWIGESSMLALAQSMGHTLHIDNNISYLPYFENNTSTFNFNDFTDILCDGISLIS